MRSRRGAALAEAGIIISLLVVLVFSIVDLAGLLWTFLALQNGINQATRFAVTGNVMPDPGNPSATLTREQSIRQAMRQATPGFTIGDGDVTFFNVSDNTPGTGGPNQIIRVTVVHAWRLFTPFLRPVFDHGLVTLRVSATMANEPF
jgi:Flp pilus assembly protein TadG